MKGTLLRFQALEPNTPPNLSDDMNDDGTGQTIEGYITTPAFCGSLIRSKLVRGWTWHSTLHNFGLDIVEF